MTALASLEVLDKFHVLRDDGRGRTRILIATANGEQARKVYEREIARIRKGAVRLYDRNGTLIYSFSAPPIRPRW